MAKLELTGFDELDKFLKSLCKPEEFAIKAVDKAAPVLEKHVKNNIRAASNSDRLAESFSLTQTKQNDLGVYSVVRPTGDFNEGLTNAELAAQFEYGRRGGYKRPDKKRPATEMKARPWRDKSVNDAKPECEEIMRKVIYEEIDKL